MDLLEQSLARGIPTLAPTPEPEPELEPETEPPVLTEPIMEQPEIAPASGNVVQEILDALNAAADQTVPAGDINQPALKTCKFRAFVTSAIGPSSGAGAHFSSFGFGRTIAAPNTLLDVLDWLLPPLR